VTDLIELVSAIDGICQAQAAADADYFLRCGLRPCSTAEEAAIRDAFLKAYRWQYIVTGVQEPRFADALTQLVTPAQLERVGAALAPILAHAGE
jgi:hypothetical protein